VYVHRSSETVSFVSIKRTGKNKYNVLLEAYVEEDRNSVPLYPSCLFEGNDVSVSKGQMKVRVILGEGYTEDDKYLTLDFAEDAVEVSASKVLKEDEDAYGEFEKKGALCEGEFQRAEKLSSVYFGPGMSK
jgi:hypothetical protein